MKVYTRLVIDLETDEILEAESFDYAGPVTFCQVGGSYGTSRGTSSGISRSQTLSAPDPALSALAQDLYGTAAPAGTELFRQFAEALRTGGVGAQVPVIQRAVERSRLEQSTAMRGLDERLAQTGLAGTPFGEDIRAQTMQSGALATSQIPTDITMAFLQMLPTILGSVLQTSIGGLAQAGVTAGVSESTQASKQKAKEMGATGGCCFIFIAGANHLHPVVRRYRDSHLTVRNRRGYYWLSDRLVPLMERFSLVKRLVQLTMIEPMTYYGKYYYGHNRFGFMFAPITSFWLRLFSLLGMRKPYRRRGTEEVV